MPLSLYAYPHFRDFSLANRSYRILQYRRFSHKSHYAITQCDSDREWIRASRHTCQTFRRSMLKLKLTASNCLNMMFR